jgi:hypothetical protein
VEDGGFIIIKKGVRLGKASLLSTGCKCNIEIGEKTTFFSTVFLSEGIN